MVTVVPRNSAGNDSPCLPVKVVTLLSIVLNYRNSYQFNSSEGKAEITVTRNTTEFQTTLVWRMMRKTIHLPNDQSSNYSSSNELEPLAGQIHFQKGLDTLTLPIKLREDMKTMKENNSLYLYAPGNDQLAEIGITVLNDSGVPGRVGQLRCTNVGSRELDVAWDKPKMGGPINKFKLTIRDLADWARKTVSLRQRYDPSDPGRTPARQRVQSQSGCHQCPWKVRYSKFVKVRTLNELEFLDLQEIKMSQRVARIKVKRKSTKIPMNFDWKAIGLAEVSLS